MLMVATSAPVKPSRLEPRISGQHGQRPRSELGEGDPVQKLRKGQPMKLIDHDPMKQRDQDIPSAKEDEADLEKVQASLKTPPIRTAPVYTTPCRRTIRLQRRESAALRP